MVPLLNNNTTKPFGSFSSSGSSSNMKQAESFGDNRNMRIKNPWSTGRNTIAIIAVCSVVVLWCCMSPDDAVGAVWIPKTNDVMSSHTMASIGRKLLEQLNDNSTDLVMNWRTGLAIPLYLVFAMLAISSGVGGGLFWVPLFTALMQFTVKSAAALSQSCVAGGCLGGTIYSIMQRNPHTDSRPMIDYSLTLVLMPALVQGISIGVMLNYIIPSVIISSLLVIILLLISGRTLYQGVKLVKAEKHVKKARATEDEGQDDEELEDTPEQERMSPLNSEGSESINSRQSPNAVIQDRAYERASIEAKLTALKLSLAEKGQKAPTRSLKFVKHTSRVISRKVTKIFGTIQKPLIPWNHFLEILFISAAFLGLQIGKSFFSRCSWQVWTMFGIQIAFMVACSAFFIWCHEHPVPIKHSHHKVASDLVMQGESSQQEGDVSDDEEDEEWKPSKLALIWVLTLVLGVLSGTVGLGGGVLMTPLLLELHVHPQTAAATSTFITLFASTTAAVSFGLDGRLNLQYMALYAPLCLIGGFLGVYILTGLIKKYKFTGMVSVLVGVLVFVSAVLVIAFALRESIQDIVNGQPFEVDDYCNA